MLQCKCGEWDTKIIKTEGSIYSDAHGNSWMTIKEYYQCPLCNQQYVIEYSGLASEEYSEEIEDES